MAISTINPAIGQLIKTFPSLSDSEIESKLKNAIKAFNLHKKTSLSDRAEKMLRVAEILDAEAESYAKIITLEMGKLFRAAVGEVKKCASNCRFYAENAEKFLAPERVETSAKKSQIYFQPIGPVLAIMPWNFPFWQLFRFAAPALMAGNVALLKHASNVPQCALAIEEIFLRAGFLENTFQTLLIGSDKVAQIIESPQIAAVTLTGSVAAGQSVASVAGRAIKKTVLELGGSDPFIVMPSADLEKAVKTAVQAKILNSGQSCIAAKRFIVHSAIAAEFEKEFVREMSQLKCGDPFDETTQLGPLATLDILESLDSQVKKTLSLKADLLLGGKRADRPGFFYLPTVLTHVSPESPASMDELFGPVASIFKVNSLAEAIKLANGTSFGLGASAWTQDAKEQAQLIEEIQAGSLFLNSMVVSDPRVPFGGVKLSGYGRELGIYGIREFVNIKTVWNQ